MGWRPASHGTSQTASPTSPPTKSVGCSAGRAPRGSEDRVEDPEVGNVIASGSADGRPQEVDANGVQTQGLHRAECALECFGIDSPGQSAPSDGTK
jgi:hypothetical protein